MTSSHSEPPGLHQPQRTKIGWRPRSLRCKASLFAGCLIILVALSSGHYGWSDDQFTLEALHSFVSTGKATITTYPNALIGKGGAAYSRAEVGVKLVGMTGFLLGKGLSWLTPVPARLLVMLGPWEDIFAVCSMAVLTGLLVLITALLLKEMGLSQSHACLFAAGAIYGGPTFELSRLLISTNGGVFGLALSLLGLLRATNRWRVRKLPNQATQHIFGTGLAFLLIMRATGVLQIPALLLAWIIVVRANWRKLLIPGIWMVAGLGLKFWYNYHRSGSLLQSGYAGEPNLFLRSFRDSLFADFLLPRWSILFNSPMTIFGFTSLAALAISAVRARSRHKRNVRLAYLLFVTLLVLPTYLVYSAYVAPQNYVTRYLAEIIFVLQVIGSWQLSRWLRSGPRKVKLSVYLLVLVGALMHFCSSLVSTGRLVHTYSTTATPEGLHEAKKYFDVPMEWWDFLSQFAAFPHPDWLVAYALPRLWSVAALLLYLSGLLLFWRAVAGSRPSVRQATHQTSSLLVLFLAVPAPAIVGLAMSARQHVLTVWPKFEAPLNVTSQRVDLYRYRDRLIAEFALTFPGKGIEATKMGFDSWMTLRTRAAAGYELVKSVRLGYPNLTRSYWPGINWKDVPEGFQGVFANFGTETPWMQCFTPDVEYNGELSISLTSGTAKFPISSFRFPSSPMYRSDTLANDKLVLDPTSFLSSHGREPLGTAPMLGVDSNAVIGLVLPPAHLIPNWKDFSVDLTCYISDLRGAPLPELRLGNAVVVGGRMTPGISALRFRLPKNTERGSSVASLRFTTGSATLIPLNARISW